MRLYDKLLAQRGGYLDRAMQGAISRLAPDLEKAQCFNMSSDISLACAQVCETKPSTVIDALHLVRTPYPHTWIEWAPDDRINNRANNKPTPIKVGMLLVTDDACKEGWAALAWEHRDEMLMLCPVGLYFLWERGGIAVERYARDHRIQDVDDIVQRKRDFLSREFTTLPERWRKFQHDEKEFKAAVELEMTAAIVPLDACMLHLAAMGIGPGNYRYESFVDDLAGELPFVEAFLLLLNSRNAIVEQKRDDFARLNKARAKNRKPALKEFVNTTIRLNRVQGNRAIAAGLSRDAARLHLVRGHFKIRSSGVYWWSPHTRGKGGAVNRTGYKV